MDVYVIVLRIVHIFAGAFWFGAAAFFTVFVEPVAAELGPQGQPFMERLTRRKLPQVITASAALAVGAGILLYWEASAGLTGAWMKSGPGVTFTIGGLTAIVAFLVGGFVIRPGVQKLGELSAAESPDVPAIQSLLHHLQRVGQINLVLLVVTVLTMASARYI